MKLFFLLVVLSQILGLAAVLLTGIWMGEYSGGFAWTENPKKEFNYHPLLMVLGLVFLNTEGEINKMNSSYYDRDSLV